MVFLCAETGRLSFSDGLTLTEGMPAERLNERFHNPIADDLTLFLGAHPLRGGSLAPVCLLDRRGLRCVTLHVEGVGPKGGAGADKQRSFLFSVFSLRDPCPDSRRGVQARFPFGSVTIYTEPYSGGAAARVEYRRPTETTEE